MGMITVVDNKPILDPEVCSQLAAFERAKKAIKEKDEALRKALKIEMEEKGYKSIETDEILISYKAPYDREDFDKKTFRKEHPDLYDSYISMSTVSSSITIKTK